MPAGPVPGCSGSVAPTQASTRLKPTPSESVIESVRHGADSSIRVAVRAAAATVIVCSKPQPRSRDRRGPEPPARLASESAGQLYRHLVFKRRQARKPPNPRSDRSGPRGASAAAGPGAAARAAGCVGRGRGGACEGCSRRRCRARR